MHRGGRTGKARGGPGSRDETKGRGAARPRGRTAPDRADAL